jgi:hypothetical protein
LPRSRRTRARTGASPKEQPLVTGYEGYSRFFVGDFIRETGPSRESDFLYGALQYTF